MTIYKRCFDIKDGIQVADIPQGGIVRHVDMQGDKLCIWVEVNPKLDMQKRSFQVVGTGHEIPALSNHVGTCQHGGFVWHLYEV